MPLPTPSQTLLLKFHTPKLLDDSLILKEVDPQGNPYDGSLLRSFIDHFVYLYSECYSRHHTHNRNAKP